MSDVTKPTFSERLDTVPVRITLSIVSMVVTVVVLGGGFVYLRDNAATAPRIVVALTALLIGVGGIWALYFSLNGLAEVLPERTRDRVLPWVFIGPALATLGFFLIWPSMNTLWLSFFERGEFVGIDNYLFIFQSSAMQRVLINTVLWVFLVPAVSTSLGLLIAVITDRFSVTSEKVVKSLIFLPMAISFVGASVIWRFVYAYRPPGLAQIGLLNAIITFFGADPVAWITVRPWNNFLLMFIMVWLQTGFAMVILSAAVKGVPKDLLEAARIDGANEVRSFFNVTIPYISGTILTVGTTILFLVLKIFDVVYVMTSGQHGTNIVALRMYQEAFAFRNFGRGSALAVFLFIVVIPLLIQNVRSMREKSF